MVEDTWLTTLRYNLWINTLRPRQKSHFADDTFNRIFVNENVRISLKFSLNFVAKGPINNIPALVQIMAWRRPGDKLLSEPVMVSLLTHICVTRPQWVNNLTKVTGAARICYMNKIGKLESYIFVLILNSQKATHIELWGVFYEFFGEKIPRNIKTALHCPMSCRCNAVRILSGYIERSSDRVRVDCLILCVDIINNVSQNMAIISFRVPFAIYGFVCVELAHWNLGDRENIFITHLIITIKSEVSIFPIVVIFSVVVCLKLLYHHILSASYTHLGTAGFCFFYYSAVLWCVQISTLWSDGHTRHIEMNVLNVSREFFSGL